MVDESANLPNRSNTLRLTLAACTRSSLGRLGKPNAAWDSIRRVTLFSWEI